MTKRQNPSVGVLTDFMYRKAGMNHIPISGTFELTPLCNFSCKMCYVRKTREEVECSGRNMLSMEDWLKIARDACEKGMLYLLLTGGEPTLWPDFWKLYVELVKMGLLVSINTNGSAISEEGIQILKKYPPRRINITLYGASDETYENLCGIQGVFSKVDQTITRLRRENIIVKLNCSLTPYNASDLEKMVHYAEERKLILDIATYMFPPVRRDENQIGKNERFTPKENAFYRMKAFELQYDKETYVRYLNDIKNGSISPPGLDEGCVDPLDGRIRCRAGKASYWITWDRYMTPCGMMTEPKLDMKDRNFDETWEELVKVSGKLALSGVCHSCKNIQLCHSCAAMALAETGSVSGIPAYLCSTIQELQYLAVKQLKELKNN